MAELLDQEDSGYFPLKRKFFKHPFWQEDRIYSRSEAWLDLLQAARFEEKPITKLIDGRVVKWGRGQVPASFRFLADRWKWSKHKVENFINLLKKEEMISVENASGQSILTLLNYDYHNSGTGKGTARGQRNKPPATITPEPGDTNGDTHGDGGGPPGGHPGDKYNKVNKENKDEEGKGAEAPAPPTELEIKFEDFKEWIKKFAPNVAKMQEPYTLKQYAELRKRIQSKDPKKHINQETVSNLLRVMHNRKDLNKKNVSAHLTLLNWSRNEFNQISTPTNGHNGQTQPGRIAQTFRQIEEQQQAKI